MIGIVRVLFLCVASVACAGKNSGSLEKQNADQNSIEKKERTFTEDELRIIADLKAFLACCNNHLIEEPCNNFNELRELFFLQLRQKQKENLGERKD